jgi:tellurite resistance protein
MAKKTNISGTLILVVLVAIAALPKEVWMLLGGTFAIFFLIKIFAKKSGEKPSDSHLDYQPGKSTSLPSARKFQSSNDDEPVGVSKSKTTEDPYHRIPNAPKGAGQAEWVPPGQSVKVGSLTIPNGMIYVGTKLSIPSGGNDPCLINPNKSIASRGDYTQRQFGYWPSYSEISSTARRAYLDWLIDGRKDPEADIGYVFLFFYGLERRVILDSAKDEHSDWPLIKVELQRLLSIYGDQSNSFRRYASELLNWVSLGTDKEKLYDLPIPNFPRTYELPPYLQLALGQAAADGVPVSPELAIAWVRLDPSISMRTPAIRCGEQFNKLFRQKYSELFGDGIALPKNKTKLKFVYQPASSGFQGYSRPTLSFGDIPNVSVLTGPVKKLQNVVDAVTKELEPFSRYLAKNSNAESVLEGLLRLPPTLWPEERLNALDNIKKQVGEGILVLKFSELQSMLGAQDILTKDNALALARTLEAMNMGMEPDILEGAKIPKPEETIVLFTLPVGESISRSTPAYQTAALTLQLASAIAHADGDFCGKEASYLLQQVQSWTHLTPHHLRRLVAQLRLLMVVPVTLTTLLKKLEPIDAKTKQTLATFMATVAQSDGVVMPEEVKMLEKIYKALGIESKQVFSDLHLAVTESITSVPVPKSQGVGFQLDPARIAALQKDTEKVSALLSTNNREETSPKSQGVGFKLDPARIAALQKDTEKVSALLSTIFQEEPLPSSESEVTSEEDVVSENPGILGLDEQHSSLIRLLLSRPEWTRDELLDAASDLDLMLDGALELINEATFDNFDMALTEGDDPVEVNAEILEKLEA